MVERCLTGLLQCGEYHTDNPEEDDIISGYQNICRIEVLKLRCLIRPSKRGEWPQCGTEPGIQSVLILVHMCASAFRALLRHFSCNNHLTALITVISRDSVSPPELTRNTPVTDVLQPVQVSLVKTCRNKLKISVVQSLDGSFCHFIHFYKPLWFDHWLYGCTAAIMGTNTVTVRNNFYKESLLFQVFYHGLTCLVAVHTCIFSAKAVDGCVIIEDIDLLKIMAASNLEVIGVMCRCNLNAACSEFLVNILIGNNRDLSVCKRKFQHLAYKVLISLILRVYSNCCIAEKCLRTCGCDLNETSFLTYDRIIDVPEKSVLVLMYNLCIRNRSLAYRTPVDDSGTFVNISFLIETDKYLLNSLGTALIHGKTLALPVCGCTQFFQLVDDLSAVLFFPCPGMFHKLVTANLVLVDSLFTKFLCYLNLCSDGCVVCSRLPESLVALHSLETDQDILHGLIQCMAHMQLSGYIGRRHYDCERFFVRIYFCMEVSVVHPFFVQTILNTLGIISLCKFFAHVFLLNLFGIKLSF